jgi:hypothetical protein
MTKREIEKLEQACQDYLYMVKHAQSNPSFYAFAYRSLQNHLTSYHPNILEQLHFLEL